MPSFVNVNWAMTCQHHPAGNIVDPFVRTAIIVNRLSEYRRRIVDGEIEPERMRSGAPMVGFACLCLLV
jgi:hypothetical protein